MTYGFKDDCDKTTMLFYDELLQILLKSDRAFNYCYQYFYEDITSWRIQSEVQEKVENGISARYALSRFMASWIPWELCADKLIARVRELGRR